MKVFVAGASGAIGKPLIMELLKRGHEVLALTRSESGASALEGLGARVVRASVFDAAAVEAAFLDFRPEVIIDELTALPKDPAQMAEAAAGDRRVRIEGGAVLLEAAHRAGARRYVQQSSGFFAAPGPGLADESAPLAVNASPRVAASAQTYTELEKRLFASGLEAVAMRYGFFYGPGTWYNPDGASAAHIRERAIPVIGDGAGVWSWIHIEEAALATVAALTAKPGIYNVVDDRPEPVRVWLPAFARWIAAPAPPVISEEQALAAAGEDAVYYGTKLRGTLNRKAREVLGLRPRVAPWYQSETGA